MSTQAIRDRLAKGMTVYARVQITSTQAKLKRARVLDVKRAAAVLQIEGETKERTVIFRDIEFEAADEAPALKHADKPRLSATIGERRETTRVLPQPQPGVDLPEPRRPQRDEPVPAKSALQTWLEMGAELEGETQVEMAELQQERNALLAEREAINARVEEIEAKHAALRATVAAIRNVTKETARC